MQFLLKSTHPYTLLDRERQHGGLSHAYLLLCADEGILRESLRFFAQTFFEEDRVKKLVEKENFYDCPFFPKEGKKLSVEDATLIVEEAGIRPIEGEKKLFVIDGFHTAAPSFQNKLLKILEEPPQGVYFLLGATSEFSILPTVLSRVKKLELPSFSTPDIVGFLERNKPELSQAERAFFAEAACGKISSALSFCGDGQYKEIFEDAFSLCFASLSSLPALCKKLADKTEKERLIAVLEVLFRDAAFLAVKNGLDSYLPSTFYQKEAEKLAKTYPVGVLLDFQKKLRDTKKQLKFNANFPQCLQLLFVWLVEKRKV